MYSFLANCDILSGDMMPHNMTNPKHQREHVADEHFG